MSREEKRANQEKQLYQICNELENFGAKYRSPDDGETVAKRKSRIQNIGRSIQAAKKGRGSTTKRKNSWRGIVNSTTYPTTLLTTMKVMTQEERGSVRSSWTRKN